MGSLGPQTAGGPGEEVRDGLQGGGEAGDGLKAQRQAWLRF